MDREILPPNEIFRACICLALGARDTKGASKVSSSQPFFTVSHDARWEGFAHGAWSTTINALYVRRHLVPGLGKRITQLDVRSFFKQMAFNVIRALPMKDVLRAASKRPAVSKITIWDKNLWQTPHHAERELQTVPTHELDQIVESDGFTVMIRRGSITVGKVKALVPVLDFISGPSEVERLVISLYLTPAALGMGVNLPNLTGRRFEPMPAPIGSLAPIFSARDAEYEVSRRTPTIGEMMVTLGGVTQQIAYFAIDTLVSSADADYQQGWGKAKTLDAFIDKHFPSSGGLVPVETFTAHQLKMYEKLCAVSGGTDFLIFASTPHTYKEVLF